MENATKMKEELNMRKVFSLMIFLCLLVPFAALGEGTEHEFLILSTFGGTQWGGVY